MTDFISFLSAAIMAVGAASITVLANRFFIESSKFTKKIMISLMSSVVFLCSVICLVVLSQNYSIYTLLGIFFGTITSLTFIVNSEIKKIEAVNSDVKNGSPDKEEDEGIKQLGDLFYHAGTITSDEYVKNTLLDLSEAIPFFIKTLEEGVKKRAFLHTVGVLAGFLMRNDGNPFNEWLPTAKQDFIVNLRSADAALGIILKSDQVVSRQLITSGAVHTASIV
jgi:hypothetical protein